MRNMQGCQGFKSQAEGRLFWRGGASLIPAPFPRTVSSSDPPVSHRGHSAIPPTQRDLKSMFVECSTVFPQGSFTERRCVGEIYEECVRQDIRYTTQGLQVWG